MTECVSLCLWASTITSAPYNELTHGLDFTSVIVLISHMTNGQPGGMYVSAREKNVIPRFRAAYKI